MLSNNAYLCRTLKKDNCQNLSEEKRNIDKNFANNNLTLKKETHKYCLNCLIKCSRFKLNLTINQNKKNIGYQFNTNDIYFFQNISSNNLLKLLEQKEEKGINLNKYNIQNIKDNNNNNENILSQTLSFPIQNNQKVTDEISIWEDLSFSLNSNENSNMSCLLIEIDLNNCKEENKYFKEVSKSFLKTETNCILNGIVHEREILQKDIIFNIDPKKLTKSIELRIQKYKDQYLSLKKEKRSSFKYRNLFFTKFLNHSNLAFMFSTNNKEDLIDLENLQINYSSIPLKKFILVKLFIAINIPNSISNKNLLNDEKEITNISSTTQSSKIQPLSIYSDEIQNFDYSNSFYNNDIDNNFSVNNSMLNPNIINPFYGYNSILMANDFYMFNNMGFNNNFYDNYGMINTFSNCIFMNNNLIFNDQNKNNNIKIIKNIFNDSIILNPIIIDKKDENVLNIFNCFKTKRKSVSNFIIYKKIMKTLFTNLQKSISSLPFEKFPNIFQKLSIFGIIIPTINKYGQLFPTSFTPTLSSLTLYIKHTELYILIYNELNIKFSKKNLSTNSFENNNENFWSHNEFIELNDNIKLSLLNEYVILEFNEIKPHYNRNTLITQLKIISKSLPKTLNKVIIGNIDYQKSFYSILWSPVNTFLNHTSFLTYYYFTLNLIGILPIKLELFKWLTKIGLEKKDNNLKQENELSDSMNKVETFLCNYSLFNSYDYEFYLKNKIYSSKKM